MAPSGVRGLRLLHGLLKGLGRHGLNIPIVARTAATMAAVRGHRLALVFHRVIDGSEVSGGIVPVVSESTFRGQLDVLLDIGDVVPLTSLVDPPRVARRPRFALTFDDDLITHHDVVLPVLLEMGLPATFFVGGRSLHGLGPPWFETLDALVLSRGVPDVARSLAIPARNAAMLAERCERDAGLQRRLEEEDGVGVPEQLGRGHLRALADAGMTIGFHTLHHRLLTELPDREVDAALVDGKEELESVIGEPIRSFAYPHGKADDRVAGRVRRAGYLTAWTGRPRPIVRGDDRFVLGRSEPGQLSGRQLVARVAVNLSGWTAT